MNAIGSGECPNACRSRAEDVTKEPAPSHLIEGGFPTEASIAYLLPLNDCMHSPAGQWVSKRADHLPLYRQSQILARAGIKLHRSTLVDWIGTAASRLGSVVDRLAERLKASSKLFMPLGKLLRNPLAVGRLPGNKRDHRACFDYGTRPDKDR